MADVGIEKRIIASVIQDRAAYEKIKDVINPDTLTTPSILLLSLSKEFYERDKNAKRVDKEFLLDRIKNDIPSPTKQNLYADYATSCSDLTISASNVAHLVIELEGTQSKAELAALLVNSPASDPRVLDAIDKHRSLVGKNESESDSGNDTQILYDVSVEEINKVVSDTGNRIKLISAAITKALNGGLLYGHHVLIFARPETGKTGLVVSAIRSLCKQKLPGLYFGNEDPLFAVVERVQSCLTGMTRKNRIEDPIATRQVLDAQGYKNVRFIGLTPGSVAEIERYVQEFKPKWIIVDQIRNLTSRAENRVNQLEAIATDLRTIAKKYNILVISVTQAGDSAANKLVLEMGDVDYSNTGIPAQMDVMIGIGVNSEFEQRGERMISFCKNKTGAETPHTHFPMRFNHMQSRYEDI